jgi:hypothetical protein
MKPQAIYIRDITSQSDADKVFDILRKYYKLVLKYTIFLEQLPSEIIFNLCDKSFKVSENFLFSQRNKHDIVSTYSCKDFINLFYLDKPKFKVGDHVFITSVLSFGEITDIGNRYQKGLSYRVKLYNDVKAKYFYENDLNLSGSNIDFKTSKPKWSVGTYVEFMNPFYTNLGRRIGKGFYKISEYDENNCMVKLIIEQSCNTLSYQEFSLHNNNFLINTKWHENKPEKNNEIDLDDYFRRVSELNKTYYAGCDVANESESSSVGIMTWMQNLKNPYKPKYPMAMEYLYQGCGIRLKHEDILNNLAYPITPKDCYHPILSRKLRKPTIIISKQKRIKININKPII